MKARIRTDYLAISVHDVSVRRGERWVLKNIDVRLRGAERWALIGGNGAGKTQFLKMIAGDVWPTAGHGRTVYRLGRRQIPLVDAKERIAYVGAERQDKYARYGWNPTVRDLIATGLHGTDLLLQPVSPSERRRVREALAECGLDARADARFLSLSYGQKRLALLARALVRRPDWLLLDELYNGLDAHYRRRVDALLDGARLRGQSWIAAAHRAVDVPANTTRLLELSAGRLCRIARLGRARARLAAEAGELARGELSQSRTALRPSRTRPRPVLAAVPGADQAQLGDTDHAASDSLMSRPASRRPAAHAATPLIHISQADLFVGYRRVLRGVDWELRRGEQWAVIGDNGAGKSSFLKMLYGDLAPAFGARLQRSGFPPGSSIESWKRQVGFVSPELQTDYAIEVTIRDLVASGRHASIGLNEPPTAQDHRVADRWLRFFKLRSLARRRPREVSYGQLRRALIARALAGNAPIILLDEPLTGLDPRQRAGMKRLLRSLMRRVTLVIAVHHLEDLPEGMTHLLRLDAGRAESSELSALHPRATPLRRAGSRT